MQLMSQAQTRVIKKPTQFKAKLNEAGLMFWSALPENLEWENRANDVALLLDTVNRCLAHMLVAFYRDTPQKRTGISLPLDWTEQEAAVAQEPPWLCFTLPKLGSPIITDENKRPMHPEVKNFMRRYVTDEQDWETVDYEGMNYNGPSVQIKGKIDSLLHKWGGGDPVEK